MTALVIGMALLVSARTPQYPARVGEQRSADIIAAWEFEADERKREARA